MTLNVTPSGSRQSWDARVRVTGGHPDLLWGIGEAEALTRDDVRVERVAVDRGDQTVGYGQLLVFPEDRHTVVDAKSLHVKNPQDLLAVLEALQEHARTVHQAAVLRVSPDTHATTELADRLTEAGYRRRDRIRRGEAGPRHLVVRLGETEGELSKRLSSETLQRCRAGLRDSGVRVRRVNASDRDLSHVGLRTQHIRELLRAVGENSVFLVATERPDDAPEKALGYLWFVHTGESAMIYRLGFTDRARELGVDDALLLTGLVQLQQRLVHKVLAGDPDQPGQPMVLRELATEDHEVLGTWEFPLVGEFQLAGRAEKTRRRMFSRRSRRGRREEILPEPTTASSETPSVETPSQLDAVAASPFDDAAPTSSATAAVHDDAARGAASHGDLSRTVPLDEGERHDGPAAGTEGHSFPERSTPRNTTEVSPVAETVDADPDLARPQDLTGAQSAQGGEEAPAGRTAGRRSASKALGSARRKVTGGVAATRARVRGGSGRRGPAAPTEAGSGYGTDSGHGTDSPNEADSLFRRALAEGRAAVRDAARW